MVEEHNVTCDSRKELFSKKLCKGSSKMRTCVQTCSVCVGVGVSVYAVGRAEMGRSAQSQRKIDGSRDSSSCLNQCCLLGQLSLKSLLKLFEVLRCQYTSPYFLHCSQAKGNLGYRRSILGGQ